MKKLMVFSLLTALACGAWAGVTLDTVDYMVRVTRIDDAAKKYGLDGTIPSKVTVTLVDTGYNNTTIYSKEINFDGLEIYTDHAEYVTLSKQNYINADGRFDVTAFVKDYTSGQANVGDATIDIVDNGAASWGVTVSSTESLDPDSVYVNPNCEKMSRTELGKYAQGNFWTYLVTDEGSFKMGVNSPYYNPEELNSSADIGDLRPTPAPEPTSGLLLLMGLAGLALKRKQQAR